MKSQVKEQVFADGKYLSSRVIDGELTAPSVRMCAEEVAVIGRSNSSGVLLFPVTLDRSHS